MGARPIYVLTPLAAGLCNQLWRLAHVTAHALATGRTVVVLGFEHARAFPVLRDDPICRLPPHATRVPALAIVRRPLRLLARGARYAPLARLEARDGTLDLGSQDVTDRIAGRRAVILSGWELRAPVAMGAHADTVRRLLRLDPVHVAAGQRAVDRARRDGELVIGVHVRQGDYAQWQDGRYFYPDQQYITFMRSAAAAFPAQRVSFVVCASSPKQAGTWSGLPAHSAPGDPYGDLAALAACDRIMGPPSTFSAWAAFAGGAPYAYLDRPDVKVSQASFAEWQST
jgi:hypothetical protein